MDMIVVAVGMAAGALVGFCIFYYLIRRRERRNHDKILAHTKLLVKNVSHRK